MSDEVLITYGRVEEHSSVWEEKWSKGSSLRAEEACHPGGGDVDYIVGTGGKVFQIP